MSIQCPNCGARLTVEGTAAQATCAYCGTISRVQHRTRMFEIAKPLPPHQHGQPRYPVAVQLHSRAWYLTLLIPVIVLALGGGMAYFIQKKVRNTVAEAQGRLQRMRGTKSVKTGSSFSWQGMGPALLHDVNGDGVPDPVGRLRYVGKRDSITIGAFDANTGKQLWESDSLGNYSDTYQGPLMLHQGVLLFADVLGNVSAYSVKDGARLWKLALGERTKTFCAVADRDEHVMIVTADGKRQLAALSRGTLEAAPSGNSDCGGLPSDSQDAAGGPVERLESLRWSRKQAKAENMKVRFGLRHRDTDSVLVFGQRHPGTRIPMVGLYRAKNQPLVWKANIPAGNPMEAEDEMPILASVTPDAAVALYEMRDDTVHITKMTTADGTRQWDTTVPEGFGNSVYRGLVCSNRQKAPMKTGKELRMKESYSEE